jgi:hypothetical protein
MSAAASELALFAYKHNGEVISGLPLPMPCPFCGKLAHVTIDWCGAGFRGDCYRCGASGPLGATPLEAARHWNARADL